MGCGSSRSGKTGNGITYTVKEELTLPDGSKIEFDGDLNYGKKDSTIPTTARNSVELWESKRRKNKVEYAYSVLPDGTPIGVEVKGGKGSVRTPKEYHDTDGAIFTHIHPRGDGLLGGSFSYADLHNFATTKGVTTRAVAKEGTYSISKTKNFDGAGFLKAIKQARADSEKIHNQRCDTLNTEYRSGKINYETYLREWNKAFNSYLIRNHEAYRANQNKYGYVYTLEQN